MITPIPALRDIAGPPGEPTPYDDVTRLRAYEQSGNSPAVLYLSLGETWIGPHPGLIDALHTAPRWSHGYALTPFGWPVLREALRDYITTSHRLGGHALGTDYDVSVSQGSTRATMPDFGRLLVDDEANAVRPGRLDRLRALLPRTGARRRPIAISGSPGWDYAGALAPVGFEMRTYPLGREHDYQPDITSVTEALQRARRDTTGPLLLVLNPQHNPTGSNWLPSVVRAMIRAAINVGAALLIDDAYYGVHDPHVVPTSALEILLAELTGLAPEERPRWLAVRSLGKQFRCNGWGIGSLTASPDILGHLADRLTQRTYVNSGPIQHAMAAWLHDPRATEFLTHQNQRYAARRASVAQLLTDELGYPADAYYAGETAGYMLMRVPPWVPSAEDFRALVLRRTGVLLGEAHMSSPGQRLESQQGLVRLHIGAPDEVVIGALKAMSAAGLTWRATWR
ncbi:pyridoxal phosphate-dependent aminotransferase [Streptomyces sp. NPDC050428]|uniref:pyridoxal phosphate-dependent aminotransferase n=1 Tax=Streptomyces sp. NPDC050428 TaxID=3155757 RepID=UPI003444B180